MNFKQFFRFFRQVTVEKQCRLLSILHNSVGNGFRFCRCRAISVYTGGYSKTKRADNIRPYIYYMILVCRGGVPSPPVCHPERNEGSPCMHSLLSAANPIIPRRFLVILFLGMTLRGDVGIAPYITVLDIFTFRLLLLLRGAG